MQPTPAVLDANPNSPPIASNPRTITKVSRAARPGSGVRFRGRLWRPYMAKRAARKESLTDRVLDWVVINIF